MPVDHAYDDEYRQVYSSVIAGLCFSKINNDHGLVEQNCCLVVLVCERTDGIALLKDREEAFMFSSIDELIEIISLLNQILSSGKMFVLLVTIDFIKVIIR